MSGSEKSTIFPIQNLASSLPIYTNPENPNFVLSQYTPIYITIAASIVKILNIPPDNVHAIFLTSRFLSHFFIVSCMFLLWFFLKNRTNMIFATLSSCFVFQILSIWYLTSSRPDSLLVLLTTLLIIVTYKAIQQNNTQSSIWILAIFIAVTAFYVKQSGAINSIALGIFCIVQREYKLLIRLVLFGILFFIIYLFILPINTIPIFFTNIIGGVANSVSWGWFYDWTMRHLLLPFAPLIALNIIFTIRTFRKPTKDAFNIFLSIAGICSFLFSTMTAFKIGAGVGYFQDYLIISVIQVSYCLYQMNSKIDLPYKWEISRFFNLYVIIVAIHCATVVYMTYMSNPLQSFRFHYQEQKEIADFIKNDKQLGENELVYNCGGDGYHGYYLTHFLHKNVLMPFPDIIWLADKNDTFDFSEFSKLIADNKIRFVVCQKNSQPKSILGHEFNNMQLVKSTQEYDIYESN